jgi:hypothetical protein
VHEIALLTGGKAMTEGLDIELKSIQISVRPRRSPLTRTAR